MHFPVYALLFATCLAYKDAGTVTDKDTVLLAVEYVNYTNYQGSLANGVCCDDPTKSRPNCPPDNCDTVIQTCGERIPGTCDTFNYDLPAIPNNNSLTFGKKVGIGNKTSPGLMSFKVPYKKGDVDFKITAWEANNGTKRNLIASWSFTVDWLEPIYSSKPGWRDFYLKTNVAELAIRVVSMCAKRYFGPTCDVYCKPTSHYTCMNNGTRNCTIGWEGPLCDVMTDHCPWNLCEHGSTCVNSLTNYTCACRPQYTGIYCEGEVADPLTSLRPGSTTSSRKFEVPGTGRQGGDASTVPIAVGVSLGLLLTIVGAVITARIYLISNKKAVHPEKAQPKPEERNTTPDLRQCREGDPNRFLSLFPPEPRLHQDLVSQTKPT